MCVFPVIISLAFVPHLNAESYLDLLEKHVDPIIIVLLENYGNLEEHLFCDKMELLLRRHFLDDRFADVDIGRTYVTHIVTLDIYKVFDRVSYICCSAD